MDVNKKTKRNLKVILLGSSPLLIHTGLTESLAGRLVESCVGAHLINQAKYNRAQIYYWREQDKEVDFVVEKGGKLIAIEVKSGRKNKPTSSMLEFIEQFHPDKIIIVGGPDVSFRAIFKKQFG